MKTSDFIFSSRPRYRISRHVVFWFSWFFFMLLTVHIPGNRFYNWHIEQSEAFKNLVEKKGGMFNFLATMTWRQACVVLAQIPFFYCIIYYLLPLYYERKKHWIATTMMLLGLALLYMLVQFNVTKFIIHAHNISQNSRVGLPVLNRTDIDIINTNIFQGTFSLGTVLGFGIMIKLMKRWWQKQKETAQVIKEKANAELQLLKAQVHPHFLFNSLNNIYSFALEGSDKAPEIIKKLSGLLDYMLHGCKDPLVPIEKELTLIKDYLALEKIRYGDRLQLTVDIDMEDHDVPEKSTMLIAPLLLIPFIENSFKHGTSRMLTNPYVTLQILMTGDVLHFKLVNSKPIVVDDDGIHGNRGLGLNNVKKRLELLYPRQHELCITEDDSSFSIQLKIKLARSKTFLSKETNKKDYALYEMA